MNGRCLRDYRCYFGKREAIIIILAFAATAITNIIGTRLPVNLEPYLALCPVIGLLFGPVGSIGVNLVSFLYNISMHRPMDLIILDLLNVFLVSYIPYRLWYSIGMGRDDRPPVFDSTFNVSKFMLVMVITSFVYTMLYNVIYAFLDGTMVLDMDDLARFLKVLSFSFLFGMSAALLLRYLGVRFETPRFGGSPDDLRRRINPLVFDIILIVGAVVPTLVMAKTIDGIMLPAMAAIEYTMLIIFLLKPVDAARTDEKTVLIGRGLRINKFNRNLIERFIAMFIVLGLSFCVAIGFVSYYGNMDWPLDADIGENVVFYMSVALLAFFIPAIFILWYIERRVTVPVGAISAASRNFVSKDYDESASDFEETCRRFYGTDNEIGELARSLTKMTDDMGHYIEDIRNLNSQREMYRAELNVAKNIQESLIPHDFDSLGGTGIVASGTMEAAKYVGGDFYDFFPVDDDHVCMAIGDVSGKGVPAALFMAMTKTLIESQASHSLDPGEILANVNSGLCRNNEEYMFVTCWLGIVELSTGRMDYACAGHNPPVMKRCGHPAEMLQGKKGLVLGGMEGVRYPTNGITLGRGDAVLLYTDGVTEANHEYDGFFGTERLLGIVDSCEGRPSETVEATVGAVHEFTADAEQFDDITVLMFRYDGKDGAASD